MAFGFNFSAFRHNRKAMSFWSSATESAPTDDPNTLLQRQEAAMALSAKLGEFRQAAAERLTLPKVGSDSFVRPGGTTWSWRPQAWRVLLDQPGRVITDNRVEVADHLSLYHDCDRTELLFRQVRNTRPSDLSPFSIRLEVFAFDGGFLSLVLDLPSDAVLGLQKRHIVRLAITVEAEKPLEIFARLNIQHGPNVEQMVQEVQSGSTEQVVEFDLAYSDLNEKRIEKGWLDLIFEGAEMNQITLRDVTLCRYPRAEM